MPGRWTTAHPRHELLALHPATQYLQVHFGDEVRCEGERPPFGSDPSRKRLGKLREDPSTPPSRK